MLFRMFSAAILLAATCSIASAQSIERVAVHKDWGVFKFSGSGSNGFGDCWGASEPKKSVNTRGGQVVTVRRGDIQLMIAFTKGSAAPLVVFTGGYDYAAGASVSARIDGQSYALMTSNQQGAGGDQVGWAWPRDPSDEARMVAAMKRGAEAVISGKSRRGTDTEDTFSLLGFTAAVDAAQRACAS